MLRAKHSTSRSNSKQSKRTRPRRIAIEPLESRRLLAGDVTAEVVDGNLLLRGDRLSNQVELRAAIDGSDAIEVIGLPSEDGDLTTINGAPSFTFTGVTGDIAANMRGGDDVVYIHDLDILGDLNVRTGRGNDRVLVGGLPRGGDMIGRPLSDSAVDQAMVEGELVAPIEPVDPVPIDPVQPVDPVPILPIANVTIAGRARIVTGAGNDGIAMGSLEVYGNLNIQTGRHADVVRLGVNELPVPTDGEVPLDDGVPAVIDGEVGPPITLPVDVYGSLRLNTGRGADQAWLESVHVAHNMSVNLGRGDDLFSYDWGSVGGRININAGRGDDLVALVHLTADTIRIRGGRGDDGVGLFDVAARRINTHLGRGNDQMIVSNTTASSARFHGGGGTDMLLYEGINHFGRLRELSFEILS